MNTTITKDGHALSREEYCQLKSLEAQQRFPKEEFTAEIIEKMVHACEHEEENWMEESTHAQDEVMESVCADLLASEGDAVAPFEAQEAVELEVVPEAQWTPNSQELSMLEAAKTASLESGAFSELREVFDFDAGMRQLVPKSGAIVTPVHLAKAIGVGFKMSESGRFLCADAVRQLEAMGRYEDVLEQMGAVLRVSYGTIGNWVRTAKQVGMPYRETLPYAVCQEIACARFSKDQDENKAVIGELLKEAEVNNWSAEDARTHVKLKQGKPPRSTKKEEEWEFLIIHNGNHYLSDAYPPVEEGMEVINLKTKEYLTQEGKLEFLPLEVRK